MAREVVFHEGEGREQVRVHQLLLRLAADGVGHRPREERHGLHGQGLEDELHHEPVHERAFGVVHPEAALPVFRRARPGHEMGQFARGLRAVALGDVLDDRAGLGDDLAAVVDHGGFAQRVDALELRRREAGARVALVAAQVVGHAQLFQEPEHALGAGGFEVVDGQHGRMVRPSRQRRAQAVADPPADGFPADFPEGARSYTPRARSAAKRVRNSPKRPASSDSRISRMRFR